MRLAYLPIAAVILISVLATGCSQPMGTSQDREDTHTSNQQTSARQETAPQQSENPGSAAGTATRQASATIARRGSDATDDAKELPTTLDRDLYDRTVQNGLNFLTSPSLEDDSFKGAAGPGVVALVTTALLKHGLAAEHPQVAARLSYLMSFVQPDTGGIHAHDSPYMNYETSLVVLCLVEANADGEYDEVLAGADKFLKRIQWGGPVYSADREDFEYGGAGYGRHERPDLSNTSYLVEAFVANGNDTNDEAIQRALDFVSRSQNFEGPHNSAPFAAKNPDGGFYYTPAAGGQSQAGETDNGGLRSYGSMTYAGFKSMIYAGVDKDDPRVKAALDWIRGHYTLEENPNMGAAGLYYYYHTFAKALAAAEIDEFVDADGNSHNWRAELLDKLASTQQEDGSWINTDNPRWLEDDAQLVTGYALLALSYCNAQ